MGSRRIGEAFEGDGRLARVESLRIGGGERGPASGDRRHDGARARFGNGLKTFRRGRLGLHEHPLVGPQGGLPLGKGKCAAAAEPPDRIPRHPPTEVDRVGGRPAEICVDRFRRAGHSAVEAGIPGMVENDEQLPLLRVGVLPGERLRDHHLRPLGPPHGRGIGVLRGRIAVDIPAVERLDVVFVAAHRRVGILVLDDVGSPLSTVGRDVGRRVHARQRRERHGRHVEILEEQPPLPPPPFHRSGDVHPQACGELRGEEIVRRPGAVDHRTPGPFRHLFVEERRGDRGEIVVDPLGCVAEQTGGVPAVARDDEPGPLGLRAEEGGHPMREAGRVVVVGAEDALEFRRGKRIVGDRARTTTGGAGVVEFGAAPVVVELHLVGIVLELARRVGLGVAERRHRAAGGRRERLQPSLEIDPPAAVGSGHRQERCLVVLACRIVLAVPPRHRHAGREIGERVAAADRLDLIVGPPAVAPFDLLPRGKHERQEPVARSRCHGGVEGLRRPAPEEEIEPGIVTGRVGTRVGQGSEHGRPVDLGGAVAAPDGEREAAIGQIADRAVRVDVEAAVHVEDQAGDVDADRQPVGAADRGEAGIEEPAVMNAVVVVVGPVVDAVAVEVVVGGVVVVEGGGGFDPEHRRSDDLRPRRSLRVGFHVGEESVGGEIVGIPRLVERRHAGVGTAVDEERRVRRRRPEREAGAGPLDRRPERADAQSYAAASGRLGAENRMARRHPLPRSEREHAAAQVGERDGGGSGRRGRSEGDGERAKRTCHLGSRDGSLEGRLVAVLVDEERFELQGEGRPARAQALRLARGEDRITPAAKKEKGRLLEEMLGGKPRFGDARRQLGEGPRRGPRAARGDHVRDPEQHEQ